MRLYPLVMVVAAGKTDPLPSLDGAGSVMLMDLQLFCVVWYPKWSTLNSLIGYQWFARLSLLTRCHAAVSWPSAACPINQRRCPRGR